MIHGKEAHLQCSSIIRYLTPFLIVVERIQKHEIQVCENVQRVSILVLRKAVLNSFEAARLRDDLAEAML